MNINIGERIKQLRKSKDITGNQLAELTGISQSIISRYERNVIEPPISSLELICNALNVSLTDFFKINNDPILSNELVDKCSKLSPEKLKALIKIADYMAD